MKQVINKLVGQYKKASDAQFALSVLFCDNYDELVADLAQAGTEFADGIGDDYGASMNMAMVARSLFEAQYTVEEASLFLYAVQKALALTGASSALAAAGYILPNRNGGGRPPASATDAIVKSLTKILADKKPKKAEREAILEQVKLLLKLA